MADLYLAFVKFYHRVTPSVAKEALLWAERNAIRRDVRNYFHSVLKVPIPKFQSHGSYAMGTMVNPLDGEYGIDEGVYLQHLNKIDQNSWPDAEVVHQWLIHATGGRSIRRPTDGRICIRVRLAGQHRVNLFCYGELNGQNVMINSEAPPSTQSDPMILAQCFKNHLNLHGEQLRRMIRYLKAWADLRSMQGVEMLNGFILTIMAASYYQKHARDDVALANTFQMIFKALSTVFMVLNPIAISEDLTARIADFQKKQFLDALQSAARDANQAIAVGNVHKASMLWRKHLGDRFPKIRDFRDNRT